MLKGIKVRLYPNKLQEQILINHFGCCRKIFNVGLEYKIWLYKTYEKSISKYDMTNQLPDIRKEFNYMNNCKAEVLQNSLDGLESAFTNFFKHGFGFPKYKNKHDKQSFASKQGLFIKENKLIFLKEKIKFNCSNKDLNLLNSKDLKIKRIIYSKTKTNKYFASILIEDEITNYKLKETTNEIGIDLGLKVFLATSDGEIIDNPKFHKKAERKLKRYQRKLSKKKNKNKNWKKSNNYKKLKLKVAKQHEKVRNQKEHFQHTISKKIVNDNQVIYLENLNISGMLKNHKLAKAIQNISWGSFVGKLKYKCNFYNREVYQIDRFYPSSKTCNKCGYKKEDLTLKDRIFVCDNCNYTEDRDLNASLNILKEGKKQLTKLRIENKVGMNLPDLAA